MKMSARTAKFQEFVPKGLTFVPRDNIIILKYKSIRLRGIKQ